MSNHRLVPIVLFVTLVKCTLYDESRLHYFTVSRTSSLTVSSDVHKNGGQSLLWSWQPGDALTLQLDHEPIRGQRQLREGGIKIWLYLKQGIRGNITASFYTSSFVNYWGAIFPECQFNISLSFTGWRGVWVTFQECHLRKRMLPLYRMVFWAPEEHPGDIYIDLLRIVRTRLRWKSRDHIVPPILGRASSRRDFWQQTYRWSLVESKDKIFNEIELNHEQFQKLKDIRLIRARLLEWFDARKTTHDFTGYFRTQWNVLERTIKKAQRYFKKLNITRTNGFIQGPPLFSRNSEYGNRHFRHFTSSELKFGFVMQKVLLPLSMEYYFLSRKQEIDRVIKEMWNTRTSSKTMQSLMGDDKELTAIFYGWSKVRTRWLSKWRLWYALSKVNQKRFERILLLLDYIVDQGWQYGSALGSLDHEMNRSSKGFVTSIFFLRLPLMRAGRLQTFINITKWYLEFGELYQTHYEYRGTTCDRMRTLMLYRLMCVIIMPEVTLQESLDKLRDMDALKNWYENALKTNPGLGGVIKPDYTGFHHTSFYPNDYVIPALITASHVVYLLRGTKYEISAGSLKNLKYAVHFMRVLSVKYTIPNNVANTDPSNAEPELICLMPALAYLSMAEMGSNKEMLSKPSTDSLKAFLRMFNESNLSIRAYLKSGTGCVWKSSFTFSLGSLALLYRLKWRAKRLGIEAEQSPQGNWAKNFAALAVHRRDDWAVTVKGFNNFVWGHESSSRGNSYGVYQSYGQLIIANSDHAMKTYNIDQGWDWTRLPGTTTLRLPFEKLLMKQSRFYNPKELCGAMSFQGTNRLKNGAFVMDFERPKYKNNDAEFWFKKSVFFYDNLIVCLGSDIQAKRRSPVAVETTLFQNNGIVGERIHFIKANGFKLHVWRDNSRRFIWGYNSPGILMDVNGNGYYVHHAGKQNLNVWLGRQNSYHDVHKETKTEGHFATAWLKHGKNPVGMTYEYAILVNTTFNKLYRFAGSQERLRGLPKYEVIQQDRRAHVVRFNNSPRIGLTTFAYGVFDRNVELSGPLWVVGEPCVLMVEHGGSKSTRLILGVSYPQLNFNSTKKLKQSNDVKEEELFYMKSQEKQIWILLRERVKAYGYRVYVDGKLVDPVEAERHVRVVPDNRHAIAGSLIYFEKLLNGFTTEVHFRRVLTTLS